jgi:hypothetical protein
LRQTKVTANLRMIVPRPMYGSRTIRQQSDRTARKRSTVRFTLRAGTDANEQLQLGFAERHSR